MAVLRPLLPPMLGSCCAATARCCCRRSRSTTAAYEVEKAGGSFINTYIFPGGCLPSLEVISRTVARVTDLRQVHLEDLTAHYATTLAAWRERFLDARERLAELGYDERFRRLWELYLSLLRGRLRRAPYPERAAAAGQAGLSRRAVGGSGPAVRALTRRRARRRGSRRAGRARSPAMRRALFEDLHEDFRSSFRTFLEREVAGEYAQWEQEGIVPREVFAKAGGGGFLAMSVPRVLRRRRRRGLPPEPRDRRRVPARGAGQLRPRHHPAQRHLPALLPLLRRRPSRTSAGSPGSPAAS